MNDDISRLQSAILRVTGCSSKYVETVAVRECFHGFLGEVLWERDVAVFEIKDHPEALRVYAWAKTGSAQANARHVVVLEIPPVNSARTAVEAAMAAAIVNGSFEPS